MDVADYLMKYKTDNNLSTNKLAKLSGINEIALVKILRKETRPSAKTCTKIAKLTNINFIELMNMNK